MFFHHNVLDSNLPNFVLYGRTLDCDVTKEESTQLGCQDDTDVCCFVFLSRFYLCALCSNSVTNTIDTPRHIATKTYCYLYCLHEWGLLWLHPIMVVIWDVTINRLCSLLVIFWWSATHHWEHDNISCCEILSPGVRQVALLQHACTNCVICIYWHRD